MAEIIVLPGFTSCRNSGRDGVSINQNLNGSQVSLEISGVCVTLGEFRRSDSHIVLRRSWTPMAKKLLNLKQGHWILAVEEL
jgi:hypothetical protein